MHLPVIGGSAGHLMLETENSTRDELSAHIKSGVIEFIKGSTYNNADAQSSTYYLAPSSVNKDSNMHIKSRKTSEMSLYH